MKKTVSFSLEEETIEFLDNLKHEYNFATRSAALEKFIRDSKSTNELDINNKKELKDLIKEVLTEMNIDINSNQEVKVIEDASNDEFDKSISNTYDDMPD